VLINEFLQFFYLGSDHLAIEISVQGYDEPDERFIPELDHGSAARFGAAYEPFWNSVSESPPQM
jgi:hypothetical protein